MQTCYAQICAGEELRASLITVKQQLTDDGAKRKFRAICQNNFDVLMKCLVHEDAKVRKNAAAILGALNVDEAEDVLYDAYEAEEKRFVRAEYIRALSSLRGTAYVEQLRERYERLKSYDALPDEKKHVAEEVKALQEYLLIKDKSKKHTFCGHHRTNHVLLTTQPAFCEALLSELPFPKRIVKGGVRAAVSDMDLVFASRLWQELLFVLNCKSPILADPQAIAEALTVSDLLAVLEENHKEDTPFAFRVTVTGAIVKEARSAFAKQTAMAIEKAFSGRLINSVSHYEIELRLVIKEDAKSRTVVPYLRLYTIPDKRFRYRREAVSTSRKPYLSAGLVALARPYLKEYAQVLDAFCGVGTLLSERRLILPVRTAYGLDTYGEAIEKARVNASLAGMENHYINRSFFAFTHDYLFDEIFADMPETIGSRAETDAFYRRFFQKAAELLFDGGYIFCYSGEMGIVKKQLRLMSELRLVQQFCINEKTGMYLFVIGYSRKDPA